MIAIVAGIMMSFFFRFIASSMDVQNFECPEVGKMTPYTAMVIFLLVFSPVISFSIQSQ